MARIRVELAYVTCRDTEDVTGADEFYIAGVVITDNANLRKGILTTPISINDGQTKTFRPEETILFEGDLPDNQSVGLMLQAYDEDAAKDWSKRPEWINTTTQKVGTAAGGAVAAGLASNPIGWTAIAAGLAAGLALGGFHLAMGSDKDDQLGTTNIVIPVTGRANEVKAWHFSRSGWWSGWDYTVTYRIHREGAAIDAIEKSLAQMGHK